MSNFYILVDKKPKEVSGKEWGEWFESAGRKRFVKQEVVNDRYISTVFLGLDHNFDGGDPLLFETLVFKREDDKVDYAAEEYMTRCSTWEEAEAMHEKAVQWVRDNVKP